LLIQIVIEGPERKFVDFDQVFVIFKNMPVIP